MRFGMMAAAAAALVCAGQAQAVTYTEYEIYGIGTRQATNGIQSVGDPQQVYFRATFGAIATPGTYSIPGYGPFFTSDGFTFQQNFGLQSVSAGAPGVLSASNSGNGPSYGYAFSASVNFPDADGLATLPTSYLPDATATGSISGYYGDFLTNSGYTITGNIFSFKVRQTNFFAGPLSFVTNPVPEPATWAMLILGVAAIGYTMRRRKVAYFAHG